MLVLLYFTVMTGNAPSCNFVDPTSAVVTNSLLSTAVAYSLSASVLTMLNSWFWTVMTDEGWRA